MTNSNICILLFVTLFDIRGDYGVNIHSMKKIHLLDFSLQRLRGKSLKMRFIGLGSLRATPPISF